MGASLVGRYELLQPVGQGGMAELYLTRVAADPRGQVFVMKRILPRHAHDPRFVEMFQRELSIATGVYHPNLVPVLDHGEADGSYFMVMEYVYGVDLAELLDACGARGVEVPIGVAVSIVEQAALGLHHLHEQPDREGGKPCLVHRDVSPSNVMLGYDGVAKVTDFGIATASACTRTTEAGTMKGKAGYMSPEQCRGDALDRRSDVFALGILLYEVTVGERLFFADNDYALMNQILEGRLQQPSKRRSGYPPGLESIVMRALAGDREQRYATAKDLAAALRRFAEASALTATPERVAAFMAEALPRRPYPVFPVGPTTSVPMPTSVAPVTAMVPQPRVRQANVGLFALAGAGVLVLTTVVAAMGSASPEPPAAPSSEAARASASAGAPVPTATPTTAASSTAAPSMAVPSTAAPSTAAPSATAPGTATPSTATPSTAEPGTATPATGTPSTAEPSTAAPSTATPSGDAPSAVDPVAPSEPGSSDPAPSDLDLADEPALDDASDDAELITIDEDAHRDGSSPRRRRKRKKASPGYDLDAPRPPQ